MKLGNDVEKAVGRLVARAWNDQAFHQRLVSDPVAVLAENGLSGQIVGDTLALQLTSDSCANLIDTILDAAKNPARCGCCC